MGTGEKDSVTLAAGHTIVYTDGGGKSAVHPLCRNMDDQRGRTPFPGTSSHHIGLFMLRLRFTPERDF